LSRIYCFELRRVHSDNAQALSTNFRALVQRNGPGSSFRIQRRTRVTRTQWKGPIKKCGHSLGT